MAGDRWSNVQAVIPDDVQEQLEDHERCAAEIAAEYGAQNTDGPSSAVRALGNMLEDARSEINNLTAERDAARRYENLAQSEVSKDLARAREQILQLEALINTPHTAEFYEAIKREAAHQVIRWGSAHDAGKRTEDWIALVIYLLGKATKAHFNGDVAKLLHHVITLGAVACNWHANMTGASTAMRPGIA